MTRTTKKAAAKLNTAIAGAVKRFAPPESLTVDEWADKHRRLSPESSAEAGPWRTKRTPYLEEPHASLYGSEGAQNSHGGRLSGRQV